MSLKIIGGSSHKEFTKKICNHLGVEETKTTSKIFSNGNRFLTVDEPVRGDDVFVVQTQAPNVDEHVMELFILLQTLKHCSPNRITAVMPYMPYARSDKRDQTRVAITARLIADLLQTAGADRALVMELHAPQIQGFFSIPCDHLVAAPSIVKYLKENWDLSDFVLVAGDAGAAKMLKAYADGLELPMAIMDKRREGNDETVKIKGVIGDVMDKKVLQIDDETSSGDTLIKNAEYLLNGAGAKSVDACFVHAALGPDAAEKLNNSLIGRLVTTDTIPLDGHNLRNVEIISVAKRFADSISVIHENKSLKTMNDL